MEMKTEMVTPEQAAKYLKKNVANYRRISKAKVSLYAEEMKAGNWQLNGEAIMFDESGELKNGQHRLAAIVMAGIPVQMTIITGVSVTANIYDSGMNRSTMQMANANDVGDVSNTEAAAATVIVGRFDRAPKGKILNWLKDHRGDMKRSYKICGANSRNNLSSRAICVVVSYLMLQAGMKSFQVETFFRVFNSGNTVGADGYEPSSALVARRMFEERYKRTPNDARSRKEQAEILMMAFQDFRRGTKRQLNYKIQEPVLTMKALDALRKADGLTEVA